MKTVLLLLAVALVANAFAPSSRRISSKVRSRVNEIMTLNNFIDNQPSINFSDCYKCDPKVQLARLNHPCINSGEAFQWK
jgi:hypothetical protein